MPHELTPRHQSVLIVEDDQATRNALVHILHQLGYETVPVATMAEGLERLDGRDRAILDLNLPDGLGTHILMRIRDEHRNIRVAVTTGATGEELGHMRQLNPELILHKPISVKALIGWLEKGD